MSTRLFLVLLRATLGLGRTPELLHPVLALLACISMSAYTSFTIISHHSLPSICHHRERKDETRTLLSASLLDLGGHAVPYQPVAGLEFLHCLCVLVDEGESCALATTKVCSETKDGDIVLLGLVELTELGSEVVLGYICAVWVENIAASPLSDFVPRHSFPVFPCTYTTIWRRPRRGLRMNLRVRKVI